MNNDLLKKHIYELERKLLEPEVRQSKEKIAEILADDFIEFCSSGKIYKYDKGDLIDNKGNDHFDWEIKNFSIDILKKDIVLAKYKVIKYNKLENTKIYSLRSSIWKYTEKRWKMVFHQGTLTDKV
ncbi:MAG: DUF4440 domain-containing protein [Bacillota bacterium]